jgi:antitoxin VapB
MAPSLKDQETDRLAREVAALTGESLIGAARKSLVEWLERERLRGGETVNLAARLRALANKCSALSDLDVRSLDNSLGYDEAGSCT